MSEIRPAFELRVGDVINRKYRIEKVLGQGGMGQVVAARHLRLGTLFAIKVMLPMALSDAEAVQRFMNEARAVARLKHPNIVIIHDLDFCENGMPYIAMEHLEGMDLNSISKQRGILPFTEACAYVLQACEGLRMAHMNGIIHRDLKPANLFLTQGPNGEPFVKVLDFGIAKLLPTEGFDSVEITGTRLPMGSAKYMSPEQVRSAKHVDARTDIWALGLILYNLATCTSPWKSTTALDQFMEILGPTSIHPPSAHNPMLPPGFDAIVMRCLEREAKNRYASVAELMAALRAVCQEQVSLGQSLVLTSTIVMPGLGHTMTQGPVTMTPLTSSVLPSATVAPRSGPLPIENETATRWALTGKQDATATQSADRKKTRLLVGVGFVMTLIAGLSVGMVMRSPPTAGSPAHSTAPVAEPQVSGNAPRKTIEKPLEALPVVDSRPPPVPESPKTSVPPPLPPNQPQRLKKAPEPPAPPKPTPPKMPSPLPDRDDDELDKYSN